MNNNTNNKNNNSLFSAFKIGICSKCGEKHKELMFSNNPLDPSDNSFICFDCIKETLNYNSIEHADFFCRRFNLPFLPDL